MVCSISVNVVTLDQLTSFYVLNGYLVFNEHCANCGGYNRQFLVVQVGLSSDDKHAVAKSVTSQIENVTEKQERESCAQSCCRKITADPPPAPPPPLCSFGNLPHAAFKILVNVQLKELTSQHTSHQRMVVTQIRCTNKRKEIIIMALPCHGWFMF